MRAILRSILVLVTCFCGFCAPSSFTATCDNIVVPGNLTLMDGNSDSLAPFNIGARTVIFQQVYDASQFARYEPLGGTITDIAFRTDPKSGVFFNTTLPDIEIRFSTTSRGPDSLDPLLTSNVGADDTVVFGRGPLSIRGFGGGQLGFEVDIPLSHPFFYDPRAGNLLMEVRNLGGGNTSFLDAVNIQGDSVSSVYAFGPQGGTPMVDTIGLVTQFIITPVPEPNALWILGVGLALLGWVVSRRKAESSVPRGQNPQS